MTFRTKSCELWFNGCLCPSHTVSGGKVLLQFLVAKFYCISLGMGAGVVWYVVHVCQVPDSQHICFLTQSTEPIFMSIEDLMGCI